MDIDGTLTDSVAMHQSAFLAALLALNLPAVDTDWGSPARRGCPATAEAVK
ncbi:MULTISPECIES: hypothetical protein [Burkholderia]|uniref:hypothetical protein n=1 Tax=Burkholderia TaxID=32008 RepID=UPI0015C5D121|nr:MULTISPECIES: hypothetical protein [Burkholderia]MBY4726486.1 hypothetical protein [Burkholderia contaminans]MCI3974214.1 hypothetical protein [Burkholderia sp. HI4860]MDN7792176.1 hypothetical protein [Burkholderia contaminans]